MESGFIREEDVVKEVTDDFCGAFTEEEDFRGDSFTNNMIARGLLPDGVDTKDPRVVAIIEKLKVNCSQHKWS
jgi:hypothetical protein